MKAILPCCGFGTRMGMKPNESKEMLPDKVYSHIIDYALNHCFFHQLEPIIITRPEKEDLINYIKDKWPKVNIVLHDGSGEWPTSVLQTKHLWSDEGNVLVLPDTRFKPTHIISDIMESLKLGSKLALALHKVPDIQNWGQVTGGYVVEKPTEVGEGWAWGLIGFQSYEGAELFEIFKIKNRRYLLKDASLMFLDNFEDITRGTTRL